MAVNMRYRLPVKAAIARLEGYHETCLLPICDRSRVVLFLPLKVGRVTSSTEESRIHM